MVYRIHLEHEEQITPMIETVMNRAPYARESSDAEESLICRFDSPGVSGYFKDLSVAPGLNLTLLDIRTSRSLSFCFQTKIPLMTELGFTLKGNVGFSVNQLRQELDSYEGQGHLCCCSGDMDCRISLSPNQQLYLIEMQFDMDRFERYGSTMGFRLPSALRRLADSKSQFVSKCSTQTPAALRPVLNDLASEAVKCERRSLMLEEICTDLTRTMTRRFDENMGTGTAILSSGDIERIREARSILEQRMINPPGLLELARLVNLNDFKLKRGFKQAFGSTVHQTLTDLRLNHARELLEESCLTVSEAAMNVGYNNIGDFGQAFKRHFGVLPSRLCSQPSEIRIDLPVQGSHPA